MTTQWKVTIDMQKVRPEDAEKVIEALLPNIARHLGKPDIFQGFRYLMARYNDEDTAYARKMDAECVAYCGRDEVEEVQGSGTPEPQAQGLAHLEELKSILSGDLTPAKRGQLLHEALDICESLGLDQEWRLFKSQLERLQQQALREKRVRVTAQIV